jgi:hypothetical protein
VIISADSYELCRHTALVGLGVTGVVCKYFGVWSLRQRLWRHGIICYVALAFIIAGVFAGWNYLTAVEGNEVLVYRSAVGGQPERMWLFGQAEVPVAGAQVARLEEIPNIYLKNGARYWRTDRFRHLVNASGEPLSLLLRTPPAGRPYRRQLKAGEVLVTIDRSVEGETP